jgi:hypothetical protein
MLKLRQPGTKNQFAVGARVDVETTTGCTARVILAGSSYLSSQSSTLHFGLGADEVAAHVHIRWPDGVRQTVHAVPMGTHTLTHP